MSVSFKSRRKAVRIYVNEEENDIKTNRIEFPAVDTSSTLPSSRSLLQKSAHQKKSTLIDEPDDEVTGRNCNDSAMHGDEFGEFISTVQKKKKKKSNIISKLSFGSEDGVLEEIEEAVVKKKPSSCKAPGHGLTVAAKFRKGVAVKGLPEHFANGYGERPIYTKDYLDKLKSSIPTKRQTLSRTQGLDEEENEEEVPMTQFQEPLIPESKIHTTVIPTEAEIREKKERRARLAREADFISLDEDINDCRILLPQKKKTETRLVRDDEDFAEGFDEFVDDGRVALGKKQERQMLRRKRKEITEMIEQAEGSSDACSNDSEAERCAAYEHAQTRAGTDGLQKFRTSEETIDFQMPAHFVSLPELSTCLLQFQNTIKSIEAELDEQMNKIQETELEERDIIDRESQLQGLLVQAGDRLSAMTTGLTDKAEDLETSLLGKNLSLLTGERGLENYGEPDEL